MSTRVEIRFSDFIDWNDCTAVEHGLKSHFVDLNDMWVRVVPVSCYGLGERFGITSSEHGYDFDVRVGLVEGLHDVLESFEVLATHRVP